MSGVAEAIKVEGLAEFQANLKKLNADLPKALRVALNEAADLVVGTARPKVPKRTGRAARSLKAKSTRTAVRVSGGGNRAPWYPWLDFGGRVGRGKATRRAFLKDGRYLYDAYFQHRESGEFVETLTAALLKVAGQAGVEITDG